MQALAPVPGWFLAGGLSPHHGNLSVELLETPHNMATGLPQKKTSSIEKARHTL